MARYTESVCRQCRREGEKLFLKGDRCYTAKCAIIKRHTPERPFLPVLTKGDLREFQSDIPCVHLHKINIDRISGLSSLELQGITRAISDKISIYLYPKKSTAAPAASVARPA